MVEIVLVSYAMRCDVMCLGTGGGAEEDEEVLLPLQNLVPSPALACKIEQGRRANGQEGPGRGYFSIMYHLEGKMGLI